MSCAAAKRCDRCGKTDYDRKTRFEQQEKEFCSKACWTSWRSEVVEALRVKEAAEAKKKREEKEKLEAERKEQAAWQRKFDKENPSRLSKRNWNAFDPSDSPSS